MSERAQAMMPVPTWTGIDPGWRDGAIVRRRGDEVIAWAVWTLRKRGDFWRIRRQIGDGELEEFGKETLYGLLPGDSGRVTCEHQYIAAPRRGRRSNGAKPDDVIKVARTVGMLTADCCPTGVVYVLGSRWRKRYGASGLGAREAGKVAISVALRTLHWHNDLRHLTIPELEGVCEAALIAAHEED